MIKKKVTCLECGESDIINVDELNHYIGETDKKFATNFLAFRWRPDHQWGFQCKCGNDNRLAPQEAKDFDSLVQGDPISVQKISASLLIPDEKQFTIGAA